MLSAPDPQNWPENASDSALPVRGRYQGTGGAGLDKAPSASPFPSQPRIRPGTRQPLPFPWEWDTSLALTRKNHFLKGFSPAIPVVPTFPISHASLKAGSRDKDKLAEAKGTPFHPPKTLKLLRQMC